MNTKQQGDIGVAKAIYIYTALGYTVSIPNTDNAKYDLVVEKDGKLNRVQVKTTSYKTQYGIYQAMLKTSGGNQSWSGEISRISSNNVDLVFILTEEGITYEFPSEVLNGSATVNLGKDKDQYKVALGRW
jgi:hypothetical protein